MCAKVSRIGRWLAIQCLENGFNERSHLYANRVVPSVQLQADVTESKGASLEITDTSQFSGAAPGNDALSCRIRDIEHGSQFGRIGGVDVDGRYSPVQKIEYVVILIVGSSGAVIHHFLHGVAPFIETTRCTYDELQVVAHTADSSQRHYLARAHCRVVGGGLRIRRERGPGQGKDQGADHRAEAKMGSHRQRSDSLAHSGHQRVASYSGPLIPVKVMGALPGIDAT
jgi:hypothetical protein